MAPIDEREVARLYRLPDQPGSFGGVKKFLLALLKQGYTVTEEGLRKWMTNDDLYQLHKPSRKSFPRRPMIVQGIDHLWQVDLSDVSSLKTHNAGNRFLLFVIDGFSKYGWVRPMKDKSAATVTRAMEEVLDTSSRRPLHIQSDKGGEFVNKPFQDLMKKRNINFYTSQNEETKAAFVERVQRTFKTKMFRFFTDGTTLRYLDVLQDLMRSYNNTIHSSIGMTPTEVNKTNEGDIRKKLSRKWSRRTDSGGNLREGDQVRLSIARQVFRKGYLPQWTEEIFVVHKRLPTRPTTYRVRDVDGDVLKGSFYVQELLKVPDRGADRTFRIEKVIRTRKRGKRKELFVKWLGYPTKFNSWIREEDMV